ncbi:hypothetical protein VTN77DRAFT_7065 [Rasamsonia byssochlamydoides]|uniref:uncharacterized protein n=1 Tax=Rasamsonia byssochlamydoides TaxID=89139 RepID=UPI0037420BA2
MGQGRRMGKKQGPPPPLDESKITLLKKRKAAEADAKLETTGKKRRKAEIEQEEQPRPKKSKENGVTVNGKGKSDGAVAPEKPSKKENGKKKPVKLIESESEEEEEDSWGSDADDMMADEFDDLDGVSDGSDGSGSEEEEDEEGGKKAFEEDSVFDSEEDDHPRETMFSEDEDLSDAEQKLTAANIEGLSRKLDKQKEEEEEAARQELQAMQTNIAGDRPDVFGEAAELKAKAGLAPDMQLLRTRITETIRILSDLQNLGQPGKSRADYLQLLQDDICAYYGYTPFLAEKLMSLFTPMEAFAFFEANETPRPVVIRTNTLKTNRRTLAQALINRGVVLEPVGKWSKVGLQVFESPVPLGATPEYLAGHYILQAASSFLPVMALAPQPNERILDMAAAPGGKTTYISALMRNTGVVLANDANKQRAKGLIGNIHRLGVKNTIVSNLDAREAFPKIMGGFDRVLLDAPCTGTGVISKDPSVKTSKTERDFLAIPHMQKQLLLAAIDSTDHHSKTGGYIVYSTCSVTVEENEQVVQYALRKRPNVKIVDTGLGDFGSEGFKSYMGKQFDPKMTLARRYFPHRENVDGFFVCKLKKIGPSPHMTTKGAAAAKKDSASAEHVDGASDDEEVIDKTPITDENGKPVGEVEFGPFDDEADAEVIARGERRRIRKKGLNPKAVLNKPKKANNKNNDNMDQDDNNKDGSDGSDGSDNEEEKKAEEKKEEKQQNREQNKEDAKSESKSADKKQPGGDSKEQTQKQKQEQKQPADKPKSPKDNSKDSKKASPSSSKVKGNKKAQK